MPRLTFRQTARKGRFEGWSAVHTVPGGEPILVAFTSPHELAAFLADVLSQHPGTAVCQVLQVRSTYRSLDVGGFLRSYEPGV